MSRADFATAFWSGHQVVANIASARTSGQLNHQTLGIRHLFWIRRNLPHGDAKETRNLLMVRQQPGFNCSNATRKHIWEVGEGNHSSRRSGAQAAS